MKRIEQFEVNDGRWTIIYQDKSEKVIDSQFIPIQYEYIGESMTLNPLNEFPNEYSPIAWWNFKYGLCPIRINNKWGFVDSKLSIVIQPIFDFVGYTRSQKCACWRPEEFIHHVEWVHGICSVTIGNEQKMINERGQFLSQYEISIRNIKNLTVDNIIKIAQENLSPEINIRPWAYIDSKGRTLEHGTAVLETEEQCNAYLAAYGNMHYKKLQYTFNHNDNKNNIPYSEFKNGLEIYDWGCGQGIGTVALIEKLRQLNLVSSIKKVTLEEPSEIARSRAVIHIKLALDNDNIEIVEIPYYLPSDYGDNNNSIQKIDVKQPVAIHIFSNILDIGSVSLKGVSKLITSSGTKHFVFCIGPANLNESRINAFTNYFKNEDIHIITDFRETDFGRHPNGKAYGCLIKNFSYTLSNAESVLHKYIYYAPIQVFAAYCDNINDYRINDAVFEILAPFDMTVHKNILPVFALVSNLISRGCPTFASYKVQSALNSYDAENRKKAFQAIARIQKTLIEALISNRLNLSVQKWEILIIEDDTDIAKLALDDFYELYHHLISMTTDYSEKALPAFKLYDSKIANPEDEYDIIIDISIKKYCTQEKEMFSKYKAKNECYFVVRSSHEIYEDRFFYTTERIKYKPFVERNSRGIYIIDKEQTQHLRYFLNLIFRKEDFRPGQLPILSRALQLKSVIGLLPTGGGKSLTYQLAAMLQPAITVVVDPLKGLMKDQYDGLLHTGIDGISYINSDLSATEKREREQKLTGSQVQIMFLSPERLSIYRFREVLRSMRESNAYFAYGVIDEVHCVSEWGHDFRLAYLHLGRNLYNYVLPKEVKSEDNHISLFGLTATASFDVLADVERELSGRNSYSLEDDATVRYENTNRLELQYYVANIDATNANNVWDVGNIKEERLLQVIDDATNKINEIQHDDCIKKIKQHFIERENIIDSNKISEIKNADINVSVENRWYLFRNTDKAGIVFCPRKSENTNLSVPSARSALKKQGVTFLSTYKGGDDTSCQDDFLNGKTNMMVATKAFGMGIDKSNVRLIFHLNFPGSLESFVQEAGRAGRDRKMSLATILYSAKKFDVQNVRTRLFEKFSADYTINKFFYDSNFLGEDFEIYVMDLLMKQLPVKISNEEFYNIQSPTVANTQGIIRFLQSYPKGSVLTYYVYYGISSQQLNSYNSQLRSKNFPIFKTNIPDRRYPYGETLFRDAVQKAIYRMCVIGLIDDFTEDYGKKEFRITTICRDETDYYDFLKLYYRKYYSEERVAAMIEDVKKDAQTEGTIMACLKHLTSFVYRSIAEKRARGILDMEQFCNMAITSDKDWKDTNEDLKDFIYYYFNSKYAREGFVTYDSSINKEIPFSLKDDTNHDIHTEDEITSFELVKKYMRVVDKEIVNSDSQKDNIKHLQGAVRLIRRAAPEMNPVLNFLNIFCILFLEEEENEMLEEELYNDYKAVMDLYLAAGKRNLLNEYTELLIQHSAIYETDREYIEKIQNAIQLEEHLNSLKEITNKYLNYDRRKN